MPSRRLFTCGAALVEKGDERGRIATGDQPADEHRALPLEAPLPHLLGMTADRVSARLHDATNVEA